MAEVAVALRIVDWLATMSSLLRARDGAAMPV
jgi:hypothetical protein